MRKDIVLGISAGIVYAASVLIFNLGISVWGYSEALALLSYGGGAAAVAMAVLAVIISIRNKSRNSGKNVVHKA